MTKRIFAGLLAAALLFAPALPAGAQSDTGEIDIVVTDAGTKAPVTLARVLLDGPVVASEFTGADGKVRFTDVPAGIYRARVSSRGFQNVTSSTFEITNGKSVTVAVALALSTQLKVIGSVESHSTSTVSTNTVDQNSAQRKLSDTLAEALGKLSGVTVNTSDTDATQTVSLEGHDSSQTQLTLDGVPLNAPGTAGDLRAIGQDLFSGASVSMGPQLGGLGGGVNFSTLNPTISWNSAFSVSAGTAGKYNYSLGETGSIGKLGIALLHTYRQTTSLADGLFYKDASGLAYSHNGDGTQKGAMVKLRYQLGDSNTLTGTYLTSSNDANSLCLQDTGALPCGYGPDNSRSGAFSMYSLTDGLLLGLTSVQASIYGIQSTNTNDLLDRYINGVASPTGTRSNNKSTGFSVNAQLPVRGRHTISINAYSQNTATSYAPLVASARPFTGVPQSASYSAISLNDSVRASPKFRFNESLGISHASNAPTSLLAGIGATYLPTPNDSISASYNLGGVAAHTGRFGVLTEPGQLRFDCNGNIAYGSAPGDQPGASSSNSARLSYSHTGARASFSTSLYRQTQRDIVLPTQVNGTAFLGSPLFPPNYFQSVQAIFDSPAGCGAAPGTPFGPQNLYFSTPIGGVDRVYEGASIGGFISFGNLVVQPYYNVQVAKAVSADPRLNNPYAITIPGRQLPNTPLHRAGLTLDYKAPRSALEYLLSATYTGANNGQNLPAYTPVDAGVSANLKRGTLTLAVNNLTDAYGGIFSSPSGAVPYTTLNGTQIATIARPNAPRQIAVTYNLRFGQGVVQSNARTAGTPRGGGRFSRGEGGPGGPGGGRGFNIQPLPSSPPADPLAMSSNAACDANAQKAAAQVLTGLKSYVAAIEAAKTAAGYPATFAPASIPGIGVTYHGLGQTYALSIVLKQGASLRTLFPCVQLHFAQAADAQARHLYAEPSNAFFRLPAIDFMPAVGLYIVRGQPQTGAESFRVYKLPTSKPPAPFAMRTATTCTADVKATAKQILGELQAHFARNAATPGITIAPLAAKSGTYYQIDPDDVNAIPALIACGRVASATKEELAAVGWDGAAVPSINYAPALGLYIVARMPGQGRNGQGRPDQASPATGGAPSPSPAATPSPSP